jgi:Tfp pilus assembly protein PilX
MRKNMIKRILFKNQKGMSLLAVLVFVFVLVTIGISLLAMTSNDIKLSSLQEDSTKAFYIAEAGLAEAIEIVENNWSTNEEGTKGFPLENVEYGEGSYSVTAEVKNIEGEDGKSKTGIVLTSEGVVTQNGKTRGKRKVQITVAQLGGDSWGIFDYALAGKYEIRLEDVTTNITGNVYCDGIIENQGATLDGSASATGEYSGDTELVSGDIMEGDQVEVIEFPVMQDLIDSYSESENNIVYKSGNKIEEKTVNLDGDIYYYEGDLTVAESTINGPGAIIAEGKIKFEDGSILGSEENPVALFSNDSTFSETQPAIKFETDSAAYGILYAPQGYIKIETKSAIYGSVIGAMVENISIKIETASEIIHESHGEAIGLPVTEHVPGVVAWREVN